MWSHREKGKPMDNKPCKNCGSYGGNVGCDVCGQPIRERIAQERLARTPCSVSSVRERYTSLAKAGRKYMPQLEIDHQSFHVWYEYTTKKQAEWVRDQLASALFRMISQNAKGD